MDKVKLEFHFNPLSYLVGVVILREGKTRGFALHILPVYIYFHYEVAERA